MHGSSGGCWKRAHLCTAPALDPTIAVNVVFTAATDLYSFSGHRQGEPEYEALVTRIKNATLRVGRKLGGPMQWRERDGWSFFQAPPATALVGRGARDLLKERAVAPIEGTER